MAKEMLFGGRRSGKTLALKKKIQKKYPRILMNFYDYMENQKEICEQIFAEFGANNWLILEMNSWYGRDISDENIKRVEINNIII